MALHPSFPKSPYAELIPSERWFPADEALRASSYEKLLPPLVAQVREEVYTWRKSGYAGTSATSKSLLHWWFEREHLLEQADGSLSPFRYYFAQREAVETVIWLYEVKQARDRYDLTTKAARELSAARKTLAWKGSCPVSPTQPNSSSSKTNGPAVTSLKTSGRVFVRGKIATSNSPARRTCTTNQVDMSWRSRSLIFSGTIQSR